jgi:hypothetical protein
MHRYRSMKMNHKNWEVKERITCLLPNVPIVCEFPETKQEDQASCMHGDVCTDGACMTQRNTMRIRHVRSNHMYTREGTGWMYSSACSNRGWPYGKGQAHRSVGRTRGKTDWPGSRMVQVGSFSVRTRRTRKDEKPGHARSGDKAGLRCLCCKKRIRE